MQTEAVSQTISDSDTGSNALQFVFVVQRVERLSRKSDFEVAEIVHFPHFQIIIVGVHHLRKERRANLARVFVLRLTRTVLSNQQVHTEQLALASRVVERADRRFVRHTALHSNQSEPLRE